MDLTKVLPDIIAGEQVLKDTKLSQLFLSCVDMLRGQNLSNTVMRLIGGVIRAYLIHCNSQQNFSTANSCINAIVYCCLRASANNSPFHTKLFLEGFKGALEKEFLHRLRPALHMCKMVINSKNAAKKKLAVGQFFRVEIIPLLEDWVERCEHRRGSGPDQSLRYD